MDVARGARGPPNFHQPRPMGVLLSAHWSEGGALSCRRRVLESRQIGHLFWRTGEERGERYEAGQLGKGKRGRVPGPGRTVRVRSGRGLRSRLETMLGNLHDFSLTTTRHTHFVWEVRHVSCLIHSTCGSGTHLGLLQKILSPQLVLTLRT